MVLDILLDAEQIGQEGRAWKRRGADNEAVEILAAELHCVGKPHLPAARASADVATYGTALVIGCGNLLSGLGAHMHATPGKIQRFGGITLEAKICPGFCARSPVATRNNITIAIQLCRYAWKCSCGSAHAQIEVATIKFVRQHQYEQNFVGTWVAGRDVAVNAAATAELACCEGHGRIRW